MSEMVPLYGFGGSGGGTGGTLTVSAPAGVTVTISKDGKRKTKVADSSGVAVFKGLSGGEWTVTITDGAQTATKAATVITEYAVAIAFFSATIQVTYPAGSTCTASDGVTTLSAPDSSGTWSCVVPNAGTWTVTVTDGTSVKDGTVDITQDGQSESLTLAYWIELYDTGNQFPDITGGWGTFIYNAPAPVFNTDNVYLTVNTTNSGSRSTIYTKNKIDLTNVKTIRVHIVSATGRNDSYKSQHLCIATSATSTTGWISNVFAKKEMNITGTDFYIELDVSSVSGSYYVAYTCDGTKNTVNATIDKIDIL